MLVRRALGKPSSTTEAFFRSADSDISSALRDVPSNSSEYDITFQNAIPWQMFDQIESH